jgi:hypothetical protein
LKELQIYSSMSLRRRYTDNGGDGQSFSVNKEISTKNMGEECNEI